MKTALAGALILVAGYSLSQTGDALTEQSGLSSITSAMRINRHELAIGDILGTNFFNVSLILLVDAVFAGGPVINEIGDFEVVSSLLGTSLTEVFLVGLLERRNPVILRMGYDSLCVILLFALGLVLLFSLAP